jgi:SAM-dependent methyltransferase
MRLLRVKTRIIELWRRARFDNHNFWNARYQTDPVKGSGPGSRKENLLLKNSIIKDTIDRYAVKTILDIGCGDIAILQDIDVEHYIGVDLSDVIIKKNKMLRPHWTFVCADMTDAYDPPFADLVLCLDVLIHQKLNSNYQMLVAKVMAATRKVALVSGYSKRPDGWNVFFHERLSESIRRVCPKARIEKLAEYRETDLLRVLVPSGGCIGRGRNTGKPLS